MIVIRNIRWILPGEDNEKRLLEELERWLKLRGVERCLVRYIPDEVVDRLTRCTGRY